MCIMNIFIANHSRDESNRLRTAGLLEIPERERRTNGTKSGQSTKHRWHAKKIDLVQNLNEIWTFVAIVNVKI